MAVEGTPIGYGRVPKTSKRRTTMMPHHFRYKTHATITGGAQYYHLEGDDIRLSCYERYLMEIFAQAT
jgi:hypothetical protein